MDFTSGLFAMDAQIGSKSIMYLEIHMEGKRNNIIEHNRGIEL